jgi:hypothetical protein
MAEPGRGAVALYNGHVAAETLRSRLPPASRVLDFGEGGGLVATHLASRGMTVERCAEVGPAVANGRFDGAFAEVSNWDAVRPLALGLGDRLQPGAPVLVRLPRRPGQSAGQVFRDLGPAFSWRRLCALGLLVPGEERADWAERHPQTFAALCAAERIVRRLPVFRIGGRESLLLATKRRGATP